jgi:thioredoxin-related protein
MKLALLLLFNLFFLGEWGLDFNQAVTESKQNNKLILLNFSGSDWCGPCIKLKKDVFESDDFKAFANEKLVLIRADFPRLKKNQLDKTQQEKNEILAEKYNPNGKFPLTVLIDSKGKVLHEWEGYQPSIAKFIGEIKQFN